MIRIFSIYKIYNVFLKIYTYLLSINKQFNVPTVHFKKMINVSFITGTLVLHYWYFSDQRILQEIIVKDYGKV